MKTLADEESVEESVSTGLFSNSRDTFTRRVEISAWKRYSIEAHNSVTLEGHH